MADSQDRTGGTRSRSSSPLCVLLLAVAHRWARRLARRVLPAIWIVLVAGHYLDVTAPGLYGRDFNLYWDSQHLGNVAAMLARAAPWWLIATVAGVAVLVVVLAYVLARLAFGRVAAAMERRESRLVLGALAGDRHHRVRGPAALAQRP